MNSDSQSFALFYDPTVHVLVVWQIISTQEGNITCAVYVNRNAVNTERWTDLR